MLSPSQSSADTGSSGLPFGFGIARAKDRPLMRRAARVARFSEDPFTQNGCVIGEASSWNYVPADLLAAYGGRDFVFADRDLKNRLTVHAEVGALITGVADQSDFTAHVVWAACEECAKHLIAFGIKRVVTCLKAFHATPPRWMPQVQGGLTMLDRAGVEVLWWTKPLNISIRFDGKELML